MRRLLAVLVFVGGCTCGPEACTFETAGACAFACGQKGGRLAAFGPPGGGYGKEVGPICRCEYPAVQP